MVFNSRPSPVLKRDCLLVDHTHAYQRVFNYGATDWRFFTAIISRTDFLFVPVYRFVSGITRFLHRKHGKPNCGDKDCEISLWSTAPKCTQVKLNKHPHHSFLLPPSVVNNKEIRSEYSQYSIHKNLKNITDNTESK